jgi:phenylalanyl-tRNA synthetase alpha chain
MSELHRLERRLLVALKDGTYLHIEEISEKADLPQSSVVRALMWLAEKKFITVREEKRTTIRLGSEGLKFLKEGMPERRLVNTIIDAGGVISLTEVTELSDLNSEFVNIAIGWARRKEWLQIIKNETTMLKVEGEPKRDSEEDLIQLLSTSTLFIDELDPPSMDSLQLLMNRPNVIVKEENLKRLVKLTAEGLARANMVQETEDVSQLTPEHIRSGTWRNIKLRTYNINAPVANYWLGKKQPYKRFLDNLKLNLVALGFEEMEGPIVELMFFNCDALFMPQDHPAREIHDIYYPEEPVYGRLPERELLFLENVKSAHEDGFNTGSKGWGYDFSTNESMRLVLRSQGTALSARTMISRDLDIPGKYFSISRCYRPDLVDRTHLTEFDQVEGIVVGKELTFKDLLGVLEMFAVEVAGADRVRFRPDYFPFTEPSVELAAFKEEFGWIEFGGAGMFRPEVTQPLGVEVPVIAWGLGVNRLYMMEAGIDDIRKLYTNDLNWLRKQRLR